MIIKRRKLQWYGHVSRSGLAKPSCKTQWKGEEDKADWRRGWKTTSGNGQAWSSPSPRGQWRTGKNGGNWFAKSSLVPQRPSWLSDRWWWWWLIRCHWLVGDHASHCGGDDFCSVTARLFVQQPSAQVSHSSCSPRAALWKGTPRSTWPQRHPAPRFTTRWMGHALRSTPRWGLMDYEYSTPKVISGQNTSHKMRSKNLRDWFPIF